MWKNTLLKTLTVHAGTFSFGDDAVESRINRSFRLRGDLSKDAGKGDFSLASISVRGVVGMGGSTDGELGRAGAPADCYVSTRLL